MTVTQALSGDESERTRSMAALRRAREREKQRLSMRQETMKITRDVVVPEVITVQELANRMAERGADVIKSLMRMGVMATINQTIDADTAELVVAEFGHRMRRVSESDVEVGLKGDEDIEENLIARAPVVTVMGHVDHGKTSLLDALRSTDVASREAGGITQHIGAYQVVLSSGGKITFIDTPGHAAFTEMRARGANVTDVVVLVVAADDGIMPQTVEAIHHAKAAQVPIIVAINKCDLPDANPDRVRQELLQHELVVEEMGGDVLAVEVSAKTRMGLDKIEEAILLQAEILELRANPNRVAEGVVIEAKLERGRGSVATVLVQRGTLRVGDIFVAGAEWGRVRALVNDRGASTDTAGPAMPIEVLGLNGTPMAGDEFAVVETEARAREITEFRQRKKREAASAAGSRGTLEQMFTRIQAGEAKELPIVIKGDVQGSIEAISGALERLTSHQHGSEGAGAPQLGRCHQRIRRDPGERVQGHDLRLQRPCQPPGPRDGQARRHRDPLLLGHLRCHRRREGGPHRHAVADPARTLPGQRPDPRSLQHHQGRQGRGLHDHRRRRQAWRRRPSAARQRGHPHRHAEDPEALQGRSPRSARGLRMRHGVRELRQHPRRRRDRSLRDRRSGAAALTRAAAENLAAYRE